VLSISAVFVGLIAIGMWAVHTRLIGQSEPFATSTDRVSSTHDDSGREGSNPDF
jgi:hypothetical protein